MPDQDIPGAPRAGAPDTVTDLLRDAFDHDVRARPVDRAGLTAGTRLRLRHRRRVRRIQIAGAALVVALAVPASLQVWPGATVSTTPLTPASAPATEPGPPATPPSSPETEPEAVGTPDGDEPLPDVARARAALPAGLTLVNDDGPYGDETTPLTGLGLSCDVASPGPRTRAAQEFQWADESQTTSDQSVVTLLITRWGSGDAAEVFTAAGDGSGTCRFPVGSAPLDLAVAGAEESWGATTDLGGEYQGRPFAQVSGAARVGDLAVGVSVQGPTPDRVAVLTAVLTAAVADLRAGDPAPPGGY